MKTMKQSSLQVTWSARRGVEPWPMWQTVGGAGGVGGVRLEVAPHVALSLAGAVGAVVDRVGGSFGCGAVVDEDGDVREAAVRLLSVGFVGYPGPWADDEADCTGVVTVESECRFGPNSFELGARLAERLGPVEWEYTAGSAATLEVSRIEVEAQNAGRVAIYPARVDLM